jgi:hypothetical protein
MWLTSQAIILHYASIFFLFIELTGQVFDIQLFKFINKLAGAGLILADQSSLILQI